MSRQEVRSSAKLCFWSAESMTSLAALVHRSGSFQLCRLLHLQHPKHTQSVFSDTLEPNKLNQSFFMSSDGRAPCQHSNAGCYMTSTQAEVKGNGSVQSARNEGQWVNAVCKSISCRNTVGMLEETAPIQVNKIGHANRPNK